MTSVDITPDVQAWADALPTEVRTRVHRTAAVIAAIGAALRNGWAPDALARECSRDLGTAESIGATVMARLRQAAEIGPPRPAFATFTRPKCDRCNPYRWLEDEDRNPVRRCDCATTEATP